MPTHSLLAQHISFCYSLGFGKIDWWSRGGSTPDLRIANATLSQLSYGPVKQNPRISAPRRAPRIYGDRPLQCQARPRGQRSALTAAFTNSRRLSDLIPAKAG